MSFNDLKQYSNVWQYPNGAYVKCSSVYGQVTVDVFSPVQGVAEETRKAIIPEDFIAPVSVYYYTYTYTFTGSGYIDVLPYYSVVMDPSYAIIRTVFDLKNKVPESQIDNIKSAGGTSYMLLINKETGAQYKCGYVAYNNGKFILTVILTEETDKYKDTDYSGYTKRSVDGATVIVKINQNLKTDKFWFNITEQGKAYWALAPADTSVVANYGINYTAFTDNKLLPQGKYSVSVPNSYTRVITAETSVQYFYLVIDANSTNINAHMDAFKAVFNASITNGAHWKKLFYMYVTDAQIKFNGRDYILNYTASDIISLAGQPHNELFFPPSGTTSYAYSYHTEHYDSFGYTVTDNNVYSTNIACFYYGLSTKTNEYEYMSKTVPSVPSVLNIGWRYNYPVESTWNYSWEEPNPANIEEKVTYTFTGVLTYWYVPVLASRGDFVINTNLVGFNGRTMGNQLLYGVSVPYETVIINKPKE